MICRIHGRSHSLPDGDMLVTERPGRLRRISNGTLQQEPIGNLPEIFVAGQGGAF